jgi:hypothetical protein
MWRQTNITQIREPAKLRAKATGQSPHAAKHAPDLPPELDRSRYSAFGANVARSRERTLRPILREPLPRAKVHGAFVFDKGCPAAKPLRDRTTERAVIGEIEALARGLIPDDALDQWLVLTRAVIEAKEEVFLDEVKGVPLAALQPLLTPKLRWMAAALQRDHGATKGSQKLSDRCLALSQRPKISLDEFNRLARAFLVLIDPKTIFGAFPPGATKESWVLALRDVFEHFPMPVIMTEGDGRGTRPKNAPTPVGDEELLPFVYMRDFPVQPLGWISVDTEADGIKRTQIGFGLHDRQHDGQMMKVDAEATDPQLGDRLGDLIAVRNAMLHTRRAVAVMNRAKADVGARSRIGQAINTHGFNVTHEAYKSFEGENLLTNVSRPAPGHPYSQEETAAAIAALTEAAKHEPILAPGVIATVSPTDEVPAVNARLFAQALATRIDWRRLDPKAQKKIGTMEFRYDDPPRIKEASDPKTAPGRLTQLLRDSHITVSRKAVANPSTPLGALLERYAVVARMVARGPRSPLYQAMLVELVEAIGRRQPS